MASAYRFSLLKPLSLSPLSKRYACGSVFTVGKLSPTLVSQVGTEATVKSGTAGVAAGTFALQKVSV